MHVKYIVTIVFIGLLACFFFPYWYHTQVDTKYGILSREYEEHLQNAVRATTACNAIKEDDNKIPLLFESDDKREEAINIFYKTLEEGFNYTYSSNHSEALRLKVPCLCLVDGNGYYILYNNIYEDEDGNRNLGETLTPINTWSYVSNEYLIRYYLTDYVEVIRNSDGKYKDGSYSDVYEYFEKPEGLKSFSSKETFENTRNDFIISEINDKVNMYINEYNYEVNRISDGARTTYEMYYRFELPTVDYEDWCGLIKQPSAIAFLQGQPMQNGDEYLNIYALSGGTVIKKDGYYCTETGGEKLYHRPECSHAASYQRCYSSKARCAKSGYFPCLECNP